MQATRLFAVLAVLATLALAGCGEQSSAKGEPASAPSPEVAVVVVTPRPVALTSELSGRTAPHLIAEVRPQVSGILRKRLFAEGANVKAGEVLYQIDPAPYRATLDAAIANQARAEANVTPLRLKAQRLADLVEIKAVSQQDYDDAAAAVKQAEAEVAAAKASVEAARINLDYTRITAPISGRIGRSVFTPGALVTANQAAPLATIQQLDPLYVDVTETTAELLRLRRRLASGELQSHDPASAKVKLILEDGSPYPYEGTLKFSDVTVDQSTGSVTLRTVFPNPDALLLPGMFVRAILQEGVDAHGILVPQQGVTRNPNGEATALVVGDDEKVEPRTLQVDRSIGDQWLVSAGLKAGDRLIVEGLQRVRPGTAVTVVPFTADAGNPSATDTASPPAEG